MIPIPIYIFILLELLAVSYLDIKFRKIKNFWSILNIILALSLFFIFPDLYVLQVDSFYFTFVFFIVGFFLFLLRIMGGGDSKFLATFFLIIPSIAQDEVFIHLLTATVIVGSGFFLSNIIKNFEKIVTSLKASDLQGVKSCFGKKFAYAPVILLAWITFGASILM
ncbi:MAG: prepilin peptidase [Bdellovibrionota bacterium]|nr:prepilin peptidase [Bdellovibrionota bacterium]